jgi:hypothetical protein
MSKHKIILIHITIALFTSLFILVPIKAGIAANSMFSLAIFGTLLLSIHLMIVLALIVLKYIKGEKQLSMQLFLLAIIELVTFFILLGLLRI